jgi:UDP-glucose 4-epimerase
LANGRASLVRADVKDLDALVEALTGCEEVYHLAANADVRFGPDHPRRDLDENTIGTFNVLEAMRRCGVSRIAFSSTGSVYGEAAVIPTPEDAPFPIQTSLYGASKLAGEGLIAAYAESFGFTARIFRFVSILGERYSHGHVFDFYKQLRDDPARLRVLGNGKQRKSYLYIQDCIDAIRIAMSAGGPRVAVYNLPQCPCRPHHLPGRRRRARGRGGRGAGGPRIGLGPSASNSSTKTSRTLTAERAVLAVLDSE